MNTKFGVCGTPSATDKNRYSHAEPLPNKRRDQQYTNEKFNKTLVELYADYDPKMLLPFLRNSQHYTLEKAYEICVKRDLLKEQIFILGRMGNAKQALAVIKNKLGDIEEAIEFVSMQNDDELWEELIKQCLNKPEMVGVLLEHTVGNLDPLYIVNRVPNGLKIRNLFAASLVAECSKASSRMECVVSDNLTQISPPTETMKQDESVVNEETEINVKRVKCSPETRHPIFRLCSFPKFHLHK